MSAFTNFLGGVTTGLFGNTAQLSDYQHASRMYVANTYARAPKVGFLYFVQFNLNKVALLDATWAGSQKHIDSVGLLVKSMDLPKFNIATETLNQYNRKLPARQPPVPVMRLDQFYFGIIFNQID